MKCAYGFRAFRPNFLYSYFRILIHVRFALLFPSLLSGLNFEEPTVGCAFRSPWQIYVVSDLLEDSIISLLLAREN